MIFAYHFEILFWGFSVAVVVVVVVVVSTQLGTASEIPVSYP